MELKYDFLEKSELAIGNLQKLYFIPSSPKYSCKSCSCLSFGNIFNEYPVASVMAPPNPIIDWYLISGYMFMISFSNFIE